jgi:hypothetical protein
VALGGPDTATRAEVVWQVKLTPTSAATTNKGKVAAGTNPSFQPAALTKAFTDAAAKAKSGAPAAPFALPVDFPIPLSVAALRVCARQSTPDTDPCAIPPASSYRGLENQLYRVEIHSGGLLTDKPTFKWSRENGSVNFPILSIADATTSTTLVSLASLGRDQKLGLAVGDWVEIVDDAAALQNLAEPLLQVTALSLDDLSVTLGGLRTAANPKRGEDATLHPFLRRWDQQGRGTSLVGGAVPITEGSAANAADWISLEDGIQILFDPSVLFNGFSYYRTGDYWLIPARVATGDVEWPQTAATSSTPSGPVALPPRGVWHQFAPLARITVTNGAVAVSKDFRNFFDPLAKPMP